MNSQVENPVEDVLNSTVRSLRQLLNRFGEKLHRINNRGQKIFQTDPNLTQPNHVLMILRLKDRFLHLQKPCADLARQVSGIVEQGKINPLERITLLLALSEFESELTFANKLMNEMFKSVSVQAGWNQLKLQRRG